MHTSIADNIKKRFHATCAICEIILRRVIIELPKQWLKQKEDSLSSKRIVTTSTKASVWER